MLGIKQNSGDNKCVAVCAAMAFDSTVEAFQILTDGKPPFTELDFCRYAFREGYICGVGIGEEQFCTAIDVTDSSSIVRPEIIYNQNEVTLDTKVKIEFKLKDFPALVIVKSEDGLSEHAIYWDGKQVWDPNPMVQNGRDLNKYKILTWYPIIKLEE